LRGQTWIKSDAWPTSPYDGPEHGATNDEEDPFGFINAI